MRHPIYDAPIDEQLADLERCARSCQGMVKEQIMESSWWERPIDPANSEGLNEGEFAIGNWIVRPRFPHDDIRVIVGQSIDGERPVTECSASEQMSEHTPTREMANPFKPCPS